MAHRTLHDITQNLDLEIVNQHCSKYKLISNVWPYLFDHYYHCQVIQRIIDLVGYVRFYILICRDNIPLAIYVHETEPTPCWSSQISWIPIQHPNTNRSQLAHDLEDRLDWCNFYHGKNGMHEIWQCHILTQVIKLLVGLLLFRISDELLYNINNKLLFDVKCMSMFAILIATVQNILFGIIAKWCQRHYLKTKLCYKIWRLNVCGKMDIGSDVINIGNPIWYDGSAMLTFQLPGSMINYVIKY